MQSAAARRAGAAPAPASPAARAARVAPRRRARRAPAAARRAPPPAAPPRPPPRLPLAAAAPLASGLLAAGPASARHMCLDLPDTLPLGIDAGDLLHSPWVVLGLAILAVGVLPRLLQARRGRGGGGVRVARGRPLPNAAVGPLPTRA
jgi:hypothetical protein